jgi:hypothetical protein
MYPPAVLELHPALVSPQQLFHMIEGECASLRQLACANPAKLSGIVWTELHAAKQRITQFIDREHRMQQQSNISAAAAVHGGLTSEGIPMASLLAPVPLTLSKPGRPSNKRNRAAAEGVAARRVRAMLPVVGAETEGVYGLQQQEQQTMVSMLSASLASPSAVMAAAAAAGASAHDPPGPAPAIEDDIGCGAPSSGSGVWSGPRGDGMQCMPASSGAAVVAGGCALPAVAAARMSGKGRLLVPNRRFD